MRGNSRSVQATLDTDRVRELVWRLAFPSMLAQFVNVLYSIVDRMYIGNIPEIGPAALAGAGVCGPIVTLISSFASWVGVGGAPLMSIRMGQKHMRAASRIVANCFVLLSAMAVLIMLAVFLLKDRLLVWFGASPSIFPYADAYLTWYLLGTVFALLATGMNQFIICQGFAKTGMMSVVLGAVCNIALDPVFIFVLDMGVKGAAIATVISQMVSCACVLGFLFSKKPLVRITFGSYRRRVMAQVLAVGFSWKIVRRVLSFGLSPFLIIATDSILIIVMNMAIQRYGGSGQGDMLLTCNTIVQSFMLMISMPLGGITGGTQTVMGYNYGAKRPDRIRKAFKHVLLLGLAFTSLMFFIAHAVPEIFVRIFTREPAYIETTVWAIRIYTMGIIPMTVQYTVVDGFTGMGVAKVAVSLSLFRKFVYFLAILALPALFGAGAVFFAEPVSDVVACISSATVFLLLGGKILGDNRRL